MDNIALGGGLLPIFRGPADHMNSSSRNLTKSRQCNDLELDALECIESYGLQRGQKLCSGFMEDYRECVLSTMQKCRLNEMKIERARQLMRGERKIGEFYDDIVPPQDAYMPGPHYN